MISFAIRALVFLIAVGTIAEAQPVITSTSGLWSHKATVTVTGSGFGSKSAAAPVVWDDASGNSILDKWDGAWPNNNPTYNTSYRLPQRGIGLPHSHVTRYIAGAHGEALGPESGYNVIMFKTRTINSDPAYTYASWYQRADDAWVFGEDNNFKTFAVSTGGSPYESPTDYWYLAYNTPWPDSPTSGASYIFGTKDPTAGSNIHFPDTNGHRQWWDEAVNPMSGVWTKVEMEIKYTGQNDGSIKLWENGILRVDYFGPTDNMPGSVRTEGIGGYARMYDQPNNWRYFADVYLDYSRARVILGNAPTYDASTIREVQVPITWSDSSISFSVNLGRFAEGQTAYLYVVEPNGQVNAVGFPISGVVDTTAPTVSVDRPSAGSTLSGVVSLSATASDNTAVGGVQFTLDGVAIGAEDTVAPYVVTWNSASVPNGPHLLTAVVRDAAGNQRVSTAVIVTTSNINVLASRTGLVAAYSFDSSEGATVSDSSGNNYLGTVSGGVQFEQGRYGRALRFDGVESLVTILDAPAFDLSVGMTLEAWVNPSALSGWRTVILKETAAGLTYALYANDNTPNPAVTVNTGALDLSATGPSEVPLNVWTHLAATYDGTTLRLFVNGTLVGSRAVTGSLVASDGPLRIGGNAVWGEYFEGLIDDVRVYNRALTADEIHGDMAAPVGPPPIPETIIFGTQAYVSTGRPVIDRKTFRVTDLTGEYLLRVMSRGVTAAVITVNGRVVVRPVDLRDGNPANAGASISSIEIPIKVQAGNNQIVVTFYGRLDSVLAVEIVRAVLPPVVSEEPPPTITITSPTSGTVLTEGATIAITVDAMSRTPLSHVDLSVNGVPLSSDVTAPFRFLLTVPTDVAWLTLRVTAVDNKGHTGVSDDVTVGVMPDGLTTVTGRVVNSSNNAVAGAEVMVTVNGLLAEIYNFDTPLSELPDLKGRAPNQVRLVSAANLRNPATVFGLDPFGFGFTSHAVRYKGYLRTTVAGRYTFTFGANAGGRLIVGGVMVVDLPRGDGNFQQASGSVWLPVGWIPIRLLTFDNGNPEVQLSYAAPGTTSEVVPPAVLTPAVIPYRTRSGSTGAFAVPRVPTAFGDLTVSGTFRKVTGTVGPIAPVVDGTTDVGLLHLR